MAGIPVFQDSPSQLKNQVFVTDGTKVVALKSDSEGALAITTSGSTIDVSATDLDIRSLDSATDSVSIVSAAPLAVSATDLDIRPLTAAEDTVTVDSITDTVTVTGSVDVTATTALNTRALDSTTDNVAVTGSVTVSATDFDIRNLSKDQDTILIYGTDANNIAHPLKTNIDGTLNVATLGNNTVAVTATDLDVRDLANSTDSVAVYGNDGTTNRVLKTDATGALAITTSGSTLTVSATDLDIRPLTADDTVTVTGSVDVTSVTGTIDTRALDSATDSVSIVSANPLAVSATDLDIRPLTAADTVTVTGSVDVTSVTGTIDTRTLDSATDNVAVTGSVTVSATDLDIRSLDSATDSVSIVSANPLAVSATDLDIRPLTAADTVTVTGSVAVSSVTGSVDVTATNLDVRDLANGTDSVAVYGSDGTNNVILKTNADGTLITSNKMTFVNGPEEILSIGSVTIGVNSAQKEIGLYSNYGFFVKNTAALAVSILVQPQISPDGTTWVNDGDPITILATKNAVVTPTRFLRYARVSILLSTGITSQDVSVWFQGQY